MPQAYDQHGGNVHKLIRTLVDHDIAQRALVLRRVWNNENDPMGARELEQNNKDAEDRRRDLEPKLAERAFYKSQWEEINTAIDNTETAIARKNASDKKKREDRVHEFRREQQRFAQTSTGHPNVPPKAAKRPNAEADGIEPTAKKARTDAIDQAPENISKTPVENDITGPYLYVSKGQSEARGDGVGAIWNKVNNFNPMKVLVDQSGDYITFSPDKKSRETCDACFDGWELREFWIYDQVHKIEKRGVLNQEITEPQPRPAPSRSMAKTPSEDPIQQSKADPSNTKAPAAGITPSSHTSPSNTKQRAPISREAKATDRQEDTKKFMVVNSIFAEEYYNCISAPYLFISADQLAVKGDRVPRLFKKYFSKWGIKRVVADSRGYYIVWALDEGYEDKMKKCYEDHKKEHTFDFHDLKFEFVTKNPEKE
ncbi:hypothetical protein BDZ45DRAFT_808199 [Acephala macrosclerotiorum]|nr:hypothetical protein BDZ45DRAFT_808199 [Acephala macrosclerotiorum]